MLNEEEIKEIDELLPCHLRPAAACIDALMVVQKRRGWVSDDCVSALAKLLGMTPAEVDSVATFYTFIYRKPVGRHVILACDSISCWVMGHETIMEALKRKLGIAPGGTTADGRFTLLPAACLGACDLAPVMMVDGRLYGNLTAETLDEILENHR